MNIYLIRHGQQALPQPQLSETGVWQAHRLGQRLKKSGIQRIYSSHLERALQTAQILNQYLDVELLIRPDLREIEMGDCGEKGWEALRQEYPEFARAWDAHHSDLAYPNGEAGSDVWRRVKPILDEIAASDLEQVALVAHGGVIRTIVCGVLGVGFEHRFKLGLDHPPANCSITLLQHDPASKEIYLNGFNDQAHLEQPLS
jgi:broad specificity phosphatase PhoE